LITGLPLRLGRERRGLDRETNVSTPLITGLPLRPLKAHLSPADLSGCFNTLDNGLTSETEGIIAADLYDYLFQHP